MQIFQDDIVKTRIQVNEMNQRLTQQVQLLEERVRILEDQISRLINK